MDDHGDIKLADFSVSMFYAGNEGLVRQHPGTAAFMPPEMCSTENVGDFPISAIDVWSSGISLWFLCFGKCPFIGSSISDTYDKILHEEYDDENIFYFYV